MEITEVSENVEGTYTSNADMEPVACTVEQITVFDDGFWKGRMAIEGDIALEPLMRGAIELADGRTGEIYISAEGDDGKILFIGAASDGGPQ